MIKLQIFNFELAENGVYMSYNFLYSLIPIIDVLYQTKQKPYFESMFFF